MTLSLVLVQLGMIGSAAKRLRVLPLPMGGIRVAPIVGLVVVEPLVFVVLTIDAALTKKMFSLCSGPSTSSLCSGPSISSLFCGPSISMSSLFCGPSAGGMPLFLLLPFIIIAWTKLATMSKSSPDGEVSGRM